MKKLKENISGIDVSSTALKDEGCINSLAVVQLVTALNDTFDIEIQFSSIIKENFGSVEAKGKIVKNYLSK